MSEKLSSIYEEILEGNVKAVTEGVNKALSNNIPTEEILQDGLIAAMAEVGQLFEIGEFFVPEMMLAARAMQAGLAILKPRLQQVEVQSAGKVVIGTVKGDLHDIGKNLVGMMLEGAGFEIQDLGIDVPPEQFVQAASQNDVDIVAMSALLITTMENMAETINTMKDAGLLTQVKVMVGGAPVTEDFAKKIGADGYAADAGQAVRLAKSLLTV